MSAETFAARDAAELAVVERGGFIESRHAGAAVVLSPDGEVTATFGPSDAVVLARSALKPLQAIGSVTAGASLEGEQLALSTASHTGTDRHATVVRDMLGSVGLSEDALGCPAQWPTDSATRDAMVRDRFEPSRVRMDCSGKHAAMLIACVAAGWPTEGYLDAAHPLQVHTREIVERLAGERVAATVIDGCGAPVHALTLSGLAKAIHRVGNSSERSPFAMHRVAGALVRAVREHPWAVEGPGRPDSIVVEQFGVYSKYGAEGVQTMVAPDGTTVALKVLDGSRRAGALVALTLLARAGALSAEAVEGFARSQPLFEIRGGGVEVGRIRASV